MTKAISDAIGQYLMYKAALSFVGETYTLVLAMPTEAYTIISQDDFYKHVFVTYEISLLVYDPNVEEIITWKI